VPGPADILGHGERGLHGGRSRIGALDENLAEAIRRALKADRRAAVKEAEHYSWDQCTSLFFAGLAKRAPAELLRHAA
jgi:hypothetical protein